MDVHMTCECGRPAVYTVPGSRSSRRRADRDHELCRQCWRSHVDRQRCAPRAPRLPRAVALSRWTPTVMDRLRALVRAELVAAELRERQAAAQRVADARRAELERARTIDELRCTITDASRRLLMRGLVAQAAREQINDAFARLVALGAARGPTWTSEVVRAWDTAA